MINNTRILAFIGARSGSKGLIDKNIKLLNGQPLIAWSIQAAKKSKYVDKVVVSTDSNQYAEIAKTVGADVIIRPAELSGDHSSLMDALVHGYHQLKAEKDDFDIIINLQPTSPLRTNIHIDEALDLYFEHQNKEKSRVFSCCPVDQKYAWIMKCNEQGYANFVDNEEKNKSNHARQTNPSVLLPNGAIFILPTNDLTHFYNGNTIPYVMNEMDSIDIDTQEDFELASQLLQQ